MSLTPTTGGVQSSPHKHKALCRVQNLGLSAQALLTLNWMRAGAVSGLWSDRRAIGCQRGLGAEGWVRTCGGVVMAVEHIFGRVDFVERRVPREVVGQRWSLGLDWYQTLALSLRPETQMETKFAIRCLQFQRSETQSPFIRLGRTSLHTPERWLVGGVRAAAGLEVTRAGLRQAMIQVLREGGTGAVLSHGTEGRQTGGQGGGGGGGRAGGGRGGEGSSCQWPLVDDRTSMHQCSWRDGGRHEGPADLREVHLPN